jgi:tartronate-semialdehyde synthase
MVMLNNAYLGLIRQAENKYGMNYAVDIGYDESYGIDHVKVMEGMGGLGRRVERPEEIRDALDWAVATAEAQRRPVLVEVLIEREANAAMGTALDGIVEFEAADREVAAIPAAVGA